MYPSRRPPGVPIGGGTGSTTRESNFTARLGNTGASVSAFQCTMSVELETPIWSVLSSAVPSQYIQYFPAIFSGTIAPDLVHPRFHFPWYAGRITPSRFQWIRSVDSARHSCASFLLYPV